jgi:ferredoxin
VTRNSRKDKSGRRAFLRTAGKALAGAVGGGALLAKSVAQDEHIAGDTGAKSFPTEDYDWTEHRWAYGIDATRCIGCLRCVEACKIENGVAPDASITDTRMPMSPKPSSFRKCVTSANIQPAFRSARWGRRSGPRTV